MRRWRCSCADNIILYCALCAGSTPCSWGFLIGERVPCGVGPVFVKCVYDALVVMVGVDDDDVVLSMILFGDGCKGRVLGFFFFFFLRSSPRSGVVHSLTGCNLSTLLFTSVQFSSVDRKSVV